MHIKVGCARWSEGSEETARRRGKKLKEENGKKCSPSEMRLLLVKRENKKARRAAMACSAAEEGGENYYYRCENVEGNTKAEGKKERSVRDFMSTGLPSKLFSFPFASSTHDPTGRGMGQILWLLHWYYYVVPSFGVKSFSPSSFLARRFG